jgi:hypothetical protein
LSKAIIYVESDMDAKPSLLDILTFIFRYPVPIIAQSGVTHYKLLYPPGSIINLIVCGYLAVLMLLRLVNYQSYGIENSGSFEAC